MNLVSLKEIHAEIRPDIPEVPIPTLNRAVIRSVRTLCEKAKACNHPIDNVTIIKGITEYELADNKDLGLLAILEVKYRGSILRNGVDYEKISGNVMQLNWIPSATEPLALEVKIRSTITRTAKNMPETVLEEYFDLIRIGTLAQLYKMTMRPWTDVNLGNQFERDFLVGIDDARSKASGELSSKYKTVQYGGL